MNFDFDIIVIGSGFGGSVSACRLSEKGKKVCLLERGKEYKMHEFPRRMDEVQDKMFWDPEDNKYGYMEVHDYPASDIMTVTASGLGGGSLIYANVLLRMPPDFFKGWPGSITRDVLNPYYDKVIDMMEASPYPFDSNKYYNDTPKTKAFQEAAKKLPIPDESLENPNVMFPDLAIRFKGDFPGEQAKNKHGAIQSSCNKCGECDIGCNIHAKNTLDLNYIFKARYGENPIDLRVESEVTDIVENEDKTGYYVTYRNPRVPSESNIISAKKVIVSAGAVGSASILLKQKEKGNLQNLGPMLGKKWSGNGDLLGFTVMADNDFHPTKGPVITSAIEYRYNDYPDGFPHGMYLEDAGYPIGLSWYLNGKAASPGSFIETLKLGFNFIFEAIKRMLFIPRKGTNENIGNMICDSIDSSDFTRRTFVLLGMGRDRSDGEIYLEGPNPVLKWNLDKSDLHFDRMRGQMKALSNNLEGTFIDNPLTKLDKIVAVHPLGGCPMGDSPEEGIVDTNGEVFGHKGLYVIDGSIIPTSCGPNPSLTIAAMAEMIIDQGNW